MSQTPIDRATRPIAETAWHETALARLRQERDALRAGLAAETLAPVPLPPTAAYQQHVRHWCRVQRVRVTQQRRAREDAP